jgi:hypothetical protein
MSASRTELILQAIVAALDAEGKPEGVTVNRSRRQAVEPGELPMISVYPLREEIKKPEENRRSPVKDRRLLVRLRCRAQGTDEALDPLRQWAVMALESDPSLGGLALDTAEDSGEWAAADDSKADYSVSEMDFSVRYVTARADLTKAA